MKISVTTTRTLFQLFAVSSLAEIGTTNAFVSRNNPRQIVTTSTSTLYADTAVSDASTASPKSKVKDIGLLTFDLDDTLYPIAPVVEDANGMLNIHVT